MLPKNSECLYLQKNMNQQIHFIKPGQPKVTFMKRTLD